MLYGCFVIRRMCQYLCDKLQSLVDWGGCANLPYGTPVCVMCVLCVCCVCVMCVSFFPTDTLSVVVLEA